MFAIAAPMIALMTIQESLQKRDYLSLILVPLIALGWWYYQRISNNRSRTKLFDPTSVEHLRAKESWSSLSNENSAALREYINTHHSLESIKHLRTTFSNLGFNQARDIVILIENGKLL
jgi:hypothetical protein